MKFNNTGIDNQYNPTKWGLGVKRPYLYLKGREVVSDISSAQEKSSKAVQKKSSSRTGNSR